MKTERTYHDIGRCFLQRTRVGMSKSKLSPSTRLVPPRLPASVSAMGTRLIVWACAAQLAIAIVLIARIVTPALS